MKFNGKNLDVNRPTLTLRACSSVVERRLCKHLAKKAEGPGFESRQVHSRLTLKNCKGFLTYLAQYYV